MSPRPRGKRDQSTSNNPGDKPARKRLARQNPAAAREAERFSRAYAVLGSDGAVVTVGHRYRRFKRK